MRALVLWADDRSANLGVRALAAGSARLLERAHPGVELEFADFGGRRPELPLGRLRSLARERVTGRRGTLDWLAGFDLVLDTRGGDSFSDIYGLHRHAMMTAVAELASQAGVPLVLGPQTIGPFRSRAAALLARRTLRRARVVMSRDPVSTGVAARLGRKADVQTTDVVFALPVPPRTDERDVVVNVSGLLWQDNAHVDARRYRAVVHELIGSLLARGRRVALLAHVVGNATTDDDVPAVHEAAAAHPGLETIVPDSLDSVRRVVASARLVYGSRMHACLNALSVGTPAVPLAYSRKFAPLLADLGWNPVVDLIRSQDPSSEALGFAGVDLDAGAGTLAEEARSRIRRAVDALEALG